MAEKNIQIKNHNGTDWDSLFPKTKANITTMNDGQTVQAVVTNLLTQMANKVEQSNIDTAISNLVNSSPSTLDTLKELATALGNDPNFATTITNSLGNKVDKISGKGLSTNDFTNTLKTKLDSLNGFSVSPTAPSTLSSLWFEVLS